MTKNLDHQKSMTDSKIMLSPKKVEAVLLPTSKPNQRFHQRWWTSLPAIPARRDCPAYRRLWRQFADHTMNTFAFNDGIFAPRNRGFYVEGHEDHLVPAIFENFTLFPDFYWLECLLARLAILCDGPVGEVRWSYSYSELLPDKEGRPHADIVMMWRDNSGEAVMAIETKKPGSGRMSFGVKDNPSNGYYLRYQEMRSIDRRHQVLLVDERNLRHLPDELRSTPAVFTWQELVAIQRGAVERMEVSQEILELVLSRLDAHCAVLGLASARSHPESMCANVTRYAELRELNVPNSVKDWLVGSEFFFATRHPNSIAEPPHDWLAAEMTVSDYASQRLQTTREREQPIWLI